MRPAAGGKRERGAPAPPAARRPRQGGGGGAYPGRARRRSEEYGVSVIVARRGASFGGSDVAAALQPARGAAALHGEPGRARGLPARSLPFKEDGPGGRETASWRRCRAVPQRAARLPPLPPERPAVPAGALR